MFDGGVFPRSRDESRSRRVAATASATVACMRGRIAVVLLAGLALAPGSAQAASPVRARLAAFDSCPELLSFARGAVARTGSGGGVVVRALGEASPPFGAPTPASAPAAAPTVAGGATDVASTTNVQEAGVDEPDIVKSDARRAFLISGSSLLAYDISAAVPRLLGSLPLDAYGGELLIRGSRALVIGSGSSGGGGPIPVDSGVVAPGAALLPRFYRAQVQLTEVDIADAAAMKVARTLTVDGSYVSARLTGGTARVVLNTPPEIPVAGSPPTAAPTAGAKPAGARAAALGIRAFLPQTVLRSRISGRTFTRPLVGCSQVRHAVPYSGLDLLTVLSIDLDHGLFNVDRDAVMAGAQVVYASPGSLYVATQRYVARPIETAADVPPGMRTEIHRFDTSDAGHTTYRASGSVPGYVLNQFALSEYRDHLRVASTEDPPWLPGGVQAGTSQSSVSVLAQNAGRLETVGRVSGLGAGERIYAVRFIGDAGYVVTFHQVDPLYTLDLSVPTAPKVAGELQLAGYSAYLHPAGDNLLIGVGQDATAQGVRTGAQVSLFDVSDPAKPRRLFQHLLDPASSGSSEAEWDHHAFLWWAPKDLAVLPLQTYAKAAGGASFTGAVGLRVRRAGGITEVGRITHTVAGEQAGVRRSLVAGSRLITVSDRGIAAADLDSLAPLGFTAFPDQPVVTPDPLPLSPGAASATSSPRPARR